MQSHVDDYRRKRDYLLAELAGDYEITRPGGAFYIFPRVPWGTASQFVSEAIARELLIIPGNIFSRHDTHWSGYGAYAGYVGLMTRLKAMGVTQEDPRPLASFT